MGKKNHWALIGAICGFACFAIGLVIVFWEWYWFEIENIADLIGRWLFFGSLVAVLVVAVGLMAKSRIAVGVGAVLMAVACAMYVVLDVFKIIANIAYDSIGTTIVDWGAPVLGGFLLALYAFQAKKRAPAVVVASIAACFGLMFCLTAIGALGYVLADPSGYLGSTLNIFSDLFMALCFSFAAVWLHGAGENPPIQASIAVPTVYPAQSFPFAAGSPAQPQTGYALPGWNANSAANVVSLADKPVVRAPSVSATDLRGYKELLEEGILTQEEFEEVKNRFLGR